MILSQFSCILQHERVAFVGFLWRVLINFKTLNHDVNAAAPVPALL